MSLIVLYFLHSTSVLSFYIDVVLTLLLSTFSVTTNILFNENNLKFESKPIIARVALSPRKLSGKFRGNFHPRSENACETESAISNGIRIHLIGDNDVDHAVCFKAEFPLQMVLSNENGVFYTTMIYPWFSGSVWLSMASLTY